MLSATNTILTGLAVADLLVMLTYAPYSFHTFVRPSTDEQVQYSYGWALFTFFHANSSAVFHTVSIWLTVLLAIFRYKALRYGRRTLACPPFNAFRPKDAFNSTTSG